MLSPNNKVDNDDIDWGSRLLVPEHWDISQKYDGIRIQIFFDKQSRCTILTRNLKPFKSVFIHKLAFQLSGCMRDVVVEGEIYCEGMRFNELQHFIATIDVFQHLTRFRRLEQRVHSDLFNEVVWPFPGRTASWLCRYDHPFTINLFDVHKLEGERWIDRKDRLNSWVFQRLHQRNSMFRMIPQVKFDNLSDIDTLYKLIINDGGEGLILKHDSNRYKYGRITLNQKSLFKMKDDHRPYTGTITKVLQGTMVDPMIETSINELGYSRTSQLQEDRMPNGKAKGFEVIFASKQVMTVTLKGFNDVEKTELLRNKKEWIGRKIDFVAMKPTKFNGVPRHAKYIKG